MPIDDKPGDLVLFIGDDHLVQERRQGQIGQNEPRRDTLLHAVRGDSGEPITRPVRAGRREHLHQRGEAVPRSGEMNGKAGHDRAPDMPAS